MKKRILIIGILLFSLVWVAGKREGKAEPWSLGGECGPSLHWSMTNEGELTITGTGKMTDAPWRIDAEEVTKLNLGEGITSICARAFENYTKITEVTLPHTLVQIGNSAFSGCRKLKTVSMQGNVERIGEYAFSCCENLEELSMSSGIKKISESAFHDCYKLKEMKLPEGLEEIGDHAFFDCESLKKIVIPGTVKKIGKDFMEETIGIRKIMNFSKNKIKLPRWNRHDGGFQTNVYWYVNGKKVKTIKKGQTAKARPRVHPIAYRLQGARVKGKKPQKYMYGVETKLPARVTKKGYVFYGWKCKCPYNDRYDDCVTVVDEAYEGKIYLTPGFARFRLSNSGNHKIKIYVDLRNACYDDSIEIRYSENKDMREARQLNIKHKNEKAEEFFNSDAYGSVKTPTLKKGKRYWFQFRGTSEKWNEEYIDDEGDKEDDDPNRWSPDNIWSTKKSILVK